METEKKQAIGNVFGNEFDIFTKINQKNSILYKIFKINFNQIIENLIKTKSYDTHNAMVWT